MRPTSRSVRNCPINIRMLESQRELIDKAAHHKNVSRSEFILGSACQAAENVLLDKQLFFVDQAQHQSFLELLESPVKDNLELKALLSSRSPWEK